MNPEISEISVRKNSTLLKVENLKCSYLTRSKLPLVESPEAKNVIHNVSFQINSGETFSLVGESGSGKTTIMRAVAGLLLPTGGKITFNDYDITKTVEKRSKEVRRQIQIVFQNPDSSLNPRRRISYAIGRSFEHFLGLSGEVLTERIEQALMAVNLDPVYAKRFPPQLSKGERQRIAIARAIAAEPSLMLCDEILSALDVSVQASIIDLLIDLQKERNLTYLFISHDLAIVRSLSHYVGVLYLGRLCESGSVWDVFSPPYHPYTEVLLMAVPRPVPGQRPSEIVMAAGELKALHSQQGCFFAPRCPRKIGSMCDQDLPPWQVSNNGHGILCHIPRDELIQSQEHHIGHVV